MFLWWNSAVLTVTVCMETSHVCSAWPQPGLTLTWPHLPMQQQPHPHPFWPCGGGAGALSLGSPHCAFCLSCLLYIIVISGRWRDKDFTTACWEGEETFTVSQWHILFKKSRKRKSLCFLHSVSLPGSCCACGCLPAFSFAFPGLPAIP